MTLHQPHLAPDRPDLIWFGGADVMRFLEDLLSQEIAAAEPGQVSRSFLLTPQGKLDHLLWVLRGSEEVGLLVDGGRGEDLTAKLGRYRIRVDVDIEPSGEEAWLVIGDDALPPGRWEGDRSALVADVSWPNVRRALRVGSRPELPELDVSAYQRLRIEAGEPLMGIDVTSDTIPQETGLVPSSVSFDKGCFLGQELVARLNSRGGRVNRNLRIFRFDDGAPSTGSSVTRAGEEVGVLTSTANGLGMGLVRRGVDAGEEVIVDGRRAVVQAVPENPQQ